MQADMHYYGTYCIARAAGLNDEAAQTIAHAALYVDNSVETELEHSSDGSCFATLTTAHTMVSFQNTDRHDQRRVWVPFHFFPGGEGESFTDKLVCTKDSPLSRRMVLHHIAKEDASFALELMGVAMHVYCDTFAHYGFSGVSSRRNRVVGNSIKILQSKAVVETILGKTIVDWFAKWGEHGGLLDNIRSLISGAAELATGALGHGGVSTYPDLPFLEWSYDYEYPDLTGVETVVRNNHTDFMEAAERMHYYLSLFAIRHAKWKDDASFKSFDDIRTVIHSIFQGFGNVSQRSEKWSEVAATGAFGFIHPIPEYDSSKYEDEMELFESFEDSAEIVNYSVYRFHQAASYHRHYVLKELLPHHNIVVL